MFYIIWFKEWMPPILLYWPNILPTAAKFSCFVFFIFDKFIDFPVFSFTIIDFAFWILGDYYSYGLNKRDGELPSVALLIEVLTTGMGLKELCS